MSVYTFRERSQRWGPGASSSGCGYCGDWVPIAEPSVGLDIGVLGFSLYHVGCANRLSVGLLEDVAHSVGVGYSFTAGKDFKVRFS